MTEAQKAGNAKRCLNGRCAMTPEEKRARKKLYHAAVMADPFRRAQYAAYFRKRRAKPGMREKTNAQARARYQANLEKSREYCRAKYARKMADPEYRAAHNAKRRANRDKTNAYRRDQIRHRLIPRWEHVIRDGREEAYLRRTNRRNAALFTMYRFSRVLFDQMMAAKKWGK